MEPRPATTADLDAVVRTATSAFLDDPVWSWVFPDPSSRPRFLESSWRLYFGSSLRQGGLWMTPGAEAVTAWIPPGGTELAPEEAERMDALLTQARGDDVDLVRQLLDRFDSNHPHEPHYYLSLFATDPAHRGKGIGMSLLARDLARIDAEGAAAYLESSNPRNDRRYQSAGFEPVGAFESPDGAVALTTMWRPAGG
jgi:GNAT superfamily N-acetyltransferase